MDFLLYVIHTIGEREGHSPFSPLPCVCVKSRFSQCHFATTKAFEARWEMQMRHVQNGCLSDPILDLCIEGHSLDGKTHYRTGRGTSQAESIHKLMEDSFPSNSFSVLHANLVLKALSFRINVAQAIKFRSVSDLRTWHADIVTKIRDMFHIIYLEKKNNVFANWCLAPLGKRQISDEQFFCDFVSAADKSTLQNIVASNVETSAVRATLSLQFHFDDLKILGHLDAPLWSNTDPLPNIEEKSMLLHRAALQIAGLPTPNLWEAVRVATSSFVGCDMSDDKIIDYSDTHYVLHGFKSSNEAIEALLVPHGRHSFIAAALHCAAHLASAPLIFLRPDSTPHLFLPQHTKNQVFFVWCESDSRDLLYQALIPSSNADEISYNPNQASVSFPQQNNTQTTPVVSQSKQPHNLKFSVAEKHKCLASNVAKLLTTFSRHHDELLLTAAKHNLFVDTGGRVRLRAAQTLQMFNQLSNEKISDSRKITQRFKYLTKTLHNKNVLELLDEVKRVGLQKNSTTAEPGTQPALEKKEDALATSQNSVDISTCAAKLIHGDVIRAKLLDKTTISGHFDAFDEKGIWVIVSGTSSSTCFDLHAFSAFCASRNPSANCCDVEPTEVVSLQSDSSRGDPFLQPGENGLKTNWDGMDSQDASDKGSQEAKGDINDHDEAKEGASEYQETKEATDQKASGEATEPQEAKGEATDQKAIGEATFDDAYRVAGTALWALRVLKIPFTRFRPIISLMRLIGRKVGRGKSWHTSCSLAASHRVAFNTLGSIIGRNAWVQHCSTLPVRYIFTVGP